MQTPRMGLTGGIGSGKSAVAAMLADLGACLVDTDAIARQITAPGGAAIPALRAQFGAAIIDAQGGLDRERMRALAFAQHETRRLLEGLLHPLIGQEAERQAAAAAPGQPVVFDIPLLVESGRWRARVDRVLVIDCETETQIARVMQRSGWERAAVERVIAQQATREQRRAAADAVIYNEGLDMQRLRQAVNELWRCWRL